MSTKSHTCERCQKPFATKQQLQRHMNKKNPCVFVDTKLPQQSDIAPYTLRLNIQNVDPMEVMKKIYEMVGMENVLSMGFEKPTQSTKEPISQQPIPQQPIPQQPILQQQPNVQVGVEERVIEVKEVNEVKEVDIMKEVEKVKEVNEVKEVDIMKEVNEVKEVEKEKPQKKLSKMEKKIQLQQEKEELIETLKKEYRGECKKKANCPNIYINMQKRKELKKKLDKDIKRIRQNKKIPRSILERHQQQEEETKVEVHISQEEIDKYVELAKSLKIKSQDADVHFVKSADEKEAKRWLAERKRHDESFKDVLQILKDTGYDTKQIKYRPIPEIVFSDDEEEEEEEEENYRPLKFY